MLKAGDKIGIIAPSNAISKEDIAAGVSYLSSLGFECTLGKNIFKKDRWMAGTDAERAEDINCFFKDKDIKAIFCAAGGVGCQKLLDFIDYQTIKENPKPLFGFSDNTALQLAIYSKSKVSSYTGFILKHDFKNGKIDSFLEASLLKTLNKEKQKIKSGEKVNKGKTEGVLIGGCLSLFRNLVGTDYYPDLKNKILLLEDVDEKTYSIDLMLDQIKKSKNFNKIRGIVFGQFTDCKISENQPTTIDETISLFCKNLNIPIIKDFQYGHIPNRYILPIGKKVVLDADSCTLSF